MPTTTEDQVEVLEDLMTMRQVCALIRRSDVSVRAYMAKKNMPYVRIPGDDRPAIRFRRDRVLSWAESIGIDVAVRPTFGTPA